MDAYTITVSRVVHADGAPGEDAYDEEFLRSRWAVVSLDEAIFRVAQIGLGTGQDDPGFAEYTLLLAQVIDGRGGRVGPLTDGTHIEVKPISREGMLDAIGFHALGLPTLADDKWPWSTEDIVRAYNAYRETLEATDGVA